MYIRPLIFDRDVVGSKKLQRELCVRFGGEAKKVFLLVIKIVVAVEEEESNLKIYDVTSIGC